MGACYQHSAMEQKPQAPSSKFGNHIENIFSYMAAKIQTGISGPFCNYYFINMTVNMQAVRWA